MGFFIDSHKRKKKKISGSKLDFLLGEKQWNTSLHYGIKTESEENTEASFPL